MKSLIIHLCSVLRSHMPNFVQGPNSYLYIVPPHFNFGLLSIDMGVFKKYWSGLKVEIINVNPGGESPGGSDLAL